MRIFRKKTSPAAYPFFVGKTLKPVRILSGFAIALIAVFFLLPASITGGIYSWVKDDIPSADTILLHKASLATFIYDAKGELIGSFAAERRRLLDLDDVAPVMLQAIVAVEDARFYTHWGIDPLGIARAAFSNLRKGKIRQGASTLTQQLVRLLVDKRERTLRRKIIEAISAVRLELSLSKDEILERYLNLVYFGRGAYGVAAAARTYFDKEASELIVEEAALLAGLVQAPGRYRPFEDPGPSLARRAHVLRRMAAAGYLDPKNAAGLAKRPFRLRSPARIRVGGHFVEYVRRQLEDTFGTESLYRGGLRVYTTLNLRYQKAAESAVQKGVKALVRRRWRKRAQDPSWRGPEAALLAIHSQTGAIQAMVGGLDFKKSKFNRSVQALRQPGSAFKPIVYAAAIRNGFTPVDSILDAPLVLDGGSGRPDWKPRNYGRNFRGRLSLKDALAASRNTVSVRLVRAVGLRRVIDFARSLGIKSPISPTMSSALGSSVTTLKEMVSAYSVFANKGFYNQPFAISRVEDSTGKVLSRHSIRPSEAIRPGVAYVITQMLKGVVEHGTGRRALALNRPIAAKTGTTNEFHDNWFIGYSPSLVAGIWVGFDLPQSLGYAETGGRNAAPIFVDFFAKAVKGTPVEDFVPPPDVEFVRIDRETGLRATRASRKVGFEVFLRGTAPTRYSGSSARRPDQIFRSEGRRIPATSKSSR
jgi:penicillin-binding protein 1A